MKKSYVVLSVVIICLYVVSCNADKKSADYNVETSAAGFDKEKARSFIDSINLKFSEAIMKGDSNWVAAQYETDAEILLTGSEPIKGKEILAMWGSVSRSNEKDWSFNTTDLQGDNNFLVETGKYDIKDGSKKSVDQGKYLIVWRMQADGSWKIYRDMGNSSPMPGK